MIFFQILIFIVSIFLIAMSISGYGNLINSYFKKNFFLNIFLGFIVISFIVTITHFFFKIDLVISLIIFISGIIIFLYLKRQSVLKSLKIENINYLFIILLLIPIYLSQKYHEDFGYYHLPYALGLIEEKIVFGFANIDKPYVYNSIWLNLYSLFFLSDRNFNFLTIPSFLLYLNFILFTFNQVISKSKIIVSDYFLIVSLFYLILKFTRISEFGFDLPATIFTILAIYNYIKFSENSLYDKKKEYFFLVLIFSIFSILIKFSTIPIILLPLYLYIKYFWDLKFYIFKYKFYFIYIFAIIFFIQQFIYTGCIFFPTNFTCLNVSWFNEGNLFSEELKLVNKSYFHEAKNFFTPEEYLKNFNWFIFWLKRSFIEILEHLFTIILPSLLFLFFLKKKENYNLNFKDKFGLYIFLILGFSFWLHFSPVYRFAIHLFILLIFIFLIKYLISKKFSKKIFIIFLFSFILFNFSKNILRLNKSEKIFVGIQKIDNKFILNKKSENKIMKVYRPDVKNNSMNSWQGRACWDIPFICSYNSLKIYKKNNYLFIIK